ncbi:uncharacterized protein LOC133130157 [Conger conger]|uniref:uncharacterized protein LOC133130157 n=1 Tax=Conger conger TaxID=82655 RepID=UPI002A5AEBE8|nr:uncharacterized protein LOC133130157 [Conger conger]
MKSETSLPRALNTFILNSSLSKPPEYIAFLLTEIGFVGHFLPCRQGPLGQVFWRLSVQIQLACLVGSIVVVSVLLKNYFNIRKMSNCVSFQAQLAYILDVLAKSALAEITKLVDDGSAALRLEMSRSQRENEALKTKLLLMEGELRAVRGYGEGTPENSLNISFEVQVCDEFGEAQRQNGNRLTPEKVSMGRLESCGSVSMKTEDARLQLTHIKREPEDEELDWSESLLLSEDRLEEDPEGSQSQAEQENTCGMLRAAEGPLCEEEEEEEEELRVELKQDPEGWPLAPPPNLMQVHCVWSEAGGLGTLPEKHGPRGGKEKQRDVQGNLGCCEEFQRATPGKKIRLSGKEKMARYRARINNDPIARAEKLAKRRLWYQMRKAKGFLDHAPISALTREEVEKRRCQWRVAQRRRRARRQRGAEATGLTPPALDTGGSAANSGLYAFLPF